MPEPSLDEAVDLTRTGDVWVFRGGSVADRAVRTLTNGPRQPRRDGRRPGGAAAAALARRARPLAARRVPGQHQRGVQLHVLADAVRTRRQRSGQRAGLRRLVGPADDGGRCPRNAHDPGSYWSGDNLRLLQGATLGPEIPVDVPAAQPSRRTR